MPKSKPVSQPDETITGRQASLNSLKMMGYNFAKGGFVPETVLQKDCLPSPSAALNIMTGDGGFRPGSIVEFYGPEGGFKSWFGQELCREAQAWRPDKSTKYIDLETGLDLSVTKHVIGVNMDMLPDGTPAFDYFPQPEDDFPCAEEVFERIMDYAKSGLFSLIVLDSVAFLTPKGEMEPDKDASWSKVGGSSQIISNAIRKIKPILKRTGTILLCINQLRTKGLGTQYVYQDSYGGWGLKYAASHRYRVHCEKVKEAEDGFFRTNMSVVADKQKYHESGKDTKIEIPLIGGHGVDKEKELVELAAQAGVVSKSGTWFNYKDQRMGQGAAKAGDWLLLNPDARKEIQVATMAALCPQRVFDTPGNTTEEDIAPDATENDES